MRAGLFPGQGIDARTIAAGLVTDHPLGDRANEVLGMDVARRVRDLSRRSATVPTSLAQPAIFLAGMISYAEARRDGITFDHFAGHSLGEYTALVAADAIPFEHGLRLVEARGRAMEAAAGMSSGGMSAVLGLDLGTAEHIAETHGLTLANDNAPGQVVLSGDPERLKQAARAVREAGGRTVLLPVTGAFHSTAMTPAVADLADALASAEVRCPRVPVISNMSARPYRAPGEIRKLLLAQLTGRVRFREAIEHLIRNGVRDFLDLGPGSVAGNLAATTYKKAGVGAGV